MSRKLLSIILLLLFTVPAWAEIVHVEFEGTILETNSDLFGTAAVGSLITGSISYNTEQNNTWNAFIVNGNYLTDASSSGFTNVSGYDYSGIDSIEFTGIFNNSDYHLWFYGNGIYDSGLLPGRDAIARVSATDSLFYDCD